MKTTRRAFLRTVPAVAAALTLPIPFLPTSGVSAAWTVETMQSTQRGNDTAMLARPAGDPPFEPYWVKTFLPTKAWPTPDEIETPVASVSENRLFRVEEPQDGYRLHVWSPRSNERLYIGAEAVGPVDPPFWAEYADDGRWLDVNLTPLQHIRAMQGENEVFRDLITAGKQGLTQPGFYRITRRVYNETMDSRTDPTIQAVYRVTNVLHTQYFHGNGSAIHYNWWAPPQGFGRPSSQGCLGMRLEGSKHLWDWAHIGTPLAIHG